MPAAVVASPPSPLPLPVGVVSTIVSPPPHPVPTPVPQPLATVVPIISVVTAPPDTPMEAPPQVLVMDSQTHQVDVLFLFTLPIFVKVECCHILEPWIMSWDFQHRFYGPRYVFKREDGQKAL